MVVQIDDHETVLSVRSIAREFKINPDSADGQMLALIEQALEFVVALRLGDTLPSELNGGDASWTPTIQDRNLAVSRVRRALVRGMLTRIGQAFTVSDTLAAGWETNPTNQELLRKAIDEAATQLGGADAGEVVLRVDMISEEMGFIETLRRILTGGLAKMRSNLLRIRVETVPVARRGLLLQVQALAQRGMREIITRIAGVDALLDDILAILRDTAATVVQLRRQRDWLLRTSRAWETSFTDWTGESGRVDDGLWKLVDKTYRFLAPRFMSFNEWTVVATKPTPYGSAMIW